jgi:putative ABC transport system permease protein
MGLQMGSHKLRFAWRVLKREPAYSAVAVLGLAVALAACFLLFGLVRYAWSYNGALAGEGVYVVKQRQNLLPRPDWGENGPKPLLDFALAHGLVRDATRAKASDLSARIGNRVLPITLSVAMPNYLKFFGVRALAGDADAALARPDALVLSQGEARRLFGMPDALGKTMTIAGTAFTVRAVIPDLPPNTSPDFKILLGEGLHSWDPPPETALKAWWSKARLYLRAAPGADPAALQAALEGAVAGGADAWLSGTGLAAGHPKPYTSVGVTPLAKVFFDADLLSGREAERYGSPAAVAGLGGLGVVILLLAATNYVNLAAVRTAARRREIGVRKALGVSGPGLAAQFLAESLLVGACATAIGMVLAWLALPLFSELAGRPLAGAYGWGAWLTLAAIGIGTGLLAGAYPAWLAARVPASSALGGRAGETLEGMRMRRVLTVVQFATAIGLVAASLAVWWQAQYASHVDPGFDARAQLVLALPDKATTAAMHAFKAELAHLPDVEGVTAMSEAAGRDGMKIIRNFQRPGGVNVKIEEKAVDANFFTVFGLRALAGRLFAREKEPGVVLNAQGALTLGFTTPEAAVGQMLDRENRIIGIAPDLRYQSLREKPGPIVYVQDDKQGVVVARVRGPLAPVRDGAEALWQRHFPDEVASIETASSVFAANYSEDLRQAELLALSSLVATALACCGIFVLSSYTIRRRSREFVLRKLHGASKRQIGLLVAREWLLLLALGAALAVAPAWLWSERYLAPFVERAPMGAWPLVLAIAGVGATALAACLRQAVAAMRLPPALILRD